MHIYLFCTFLFFLLFLVIHLAAPSACVLALRVSSNNSSSGSNSLGSNSSLIVKIPFFSSLTSSSSVHTKIYKWAKFVDNTTHKQQLHNRNTATNTQATPTTPKTNHHMDNGYGWRTFWLGGIHNTDIIQVRKMQN